jgi:Ser/Thr protein kinase RdoA (MazF antagonist)
MIAQLHNAARESGWSEGSLRRPSWQEESVVRNFKLYVPQSEALVRTAFARVIRELNALPRSRASYGLIHADLNHDNLFFDDGRLVVFDFDDCCFCWFAYDLAVAIYHLPASETQNATNANAQRAFRWLLRGYGRVAQFDPEWLEWVPLFLRWRDLLIYGFFYEQLEIDSLPELFRKKFVAMRERIELGRPIADISGIR